MKQMLKDAAIWLAKSIALGLFAIAALYGMTLLSYALGATIN